MLSQGLPVQFVADSTVLRGSARQACRVTPLLAAVSGGHDDVADLLLEAGADPGAPRDGDYTPASWVLVHGSHHALEWLLARYPDPTDHLPLGASIGGLTASYVHRILYLRARGLDVLAPSRSGASVLDQAFIFCGSEDGRLETACATLVALGVETAGSEMGLSRILGAHFRNRLVQALLLGDVELTRIALEAGADPHEVLQPAGVSILQRIEGQEGNGTLYPFAPGPLRDRATQACVDIIRAHLARTAAI